MWSSGCYVASFELVIRCDNCMRESVRRLNVPDVDDAPSDVDELLDSALLAHIGYGCMRCHGVIGQVTGIRKQAVENIL